MSAPNNYQAIIDIEDVSNFKKLVPHPAFVFDFKLDDFQARSILRLEQNQSVFVSAPTSAGKTVIAQYAISLSLKHKKRVIYTSPIKALSNQKFREFKKQFDDVGILTGDVTINKQASVLIMTTEIFLSLLYNNDDEILPYVECVIFDEFHYIANEDRGCVWEESIILMPPNINMVFLSATMPNSKEIANWIANTKNRDVYIEIHEKRPIPLLHSVYISNQIINIVGDDQKFNGNAYKKASTFKPAKKGKKSQKEKIEKYDNLILNLQKNDLLPALLFIFTIDGIQKKAEMLMQSNINLLAQEQSDHVVNFFNSTIEKIPEEDRDLPQIKQMIGLLKKGIGIHHSGLFPILKEIVEILLADGYIKIILCTSTIGMGLNLPVRTCCFTSLKKFNGKGKAELTLTEYQQMSGRAGRRGNDQFGTSLVCIDKKFPSKSYLQNLFCGKAENVKSQFQMSFKLVLNSIKEDVKMGLKEIVENTFLKNENQPQNERIQGIMNDLKKKLSELDHVSSCSMQKREPGKEPEQEDDDNDEQQEKGKKQKPKGKKQQQKQQQQDDDNDDDQQESQKKPNKQQVHGNEKTSSASDDIEDLDFSAPIYEFSKRSVEALGINSRMMTIHKSDILNVLQNGMMVLLIDKNQANIGFIDNFSIKGKKKVLHEVKVYTNGKIVTCNGKDTKKLIILTLPVENYNKLDNSAKDSMINDFNPNEQVKPYKELFNVKSKKFVALSNQLYKGVLNILSSKCLMCKFCSNHYKTAVSETKYLNLIYSNKSLLNKKGNIEYQCYLNLLQDMDYIDKEDDHYVLSNKGIVASEIYGNEILSTELLCSDIFEDCSAADLAALCSCLVPHRKILKNKDNENLPSNLISKVDAMLEIAGQVKEKMSNNAIPFNENGFIESNVNTSTLSAIYYWANGDGFDAVMKKMFKVLEGHFVAVITMERSLLYNFANEAKVMGFDDLSTKFNEAAEIINHGIISIRSIYLDSA